MTPVEKSERERQLKMHTMEITKEALRLGFTAHESSWKQLRAICDAALGAAFEAGQREREGKLLDAAMIIRRLIRKLRKSDSPGDATICFESTEWLRRNNLQGSILRAGPIADKGDARE